MMLISDSVKYKLNTFLFRMIGFFIGTGIIYGLANLLFAPLDPENPTTAEILLWLAGLPIIVFLVSKTPNFIRRFGLDKMPDQHTASKFPLAYRAWGYFCIILGALISGGLAAQSAKLLPTNPSGPQLSSTFQLYYSLAFLFLFISGLFMVKISKYLDQIKDKKADAQLRIKLNKIIAVHSLSILVYIIPTVLLFFFTPVDELGGIATLDSYIKKLLFFFYHNSVYGAILGAAFKAKSYSGS